MNEVISLHLHLLYTKGILPSPVPERTVHLGDLEPNVWKGFEGNAPFNSTGLSNDDISSLGSLVKVEATWEENGRSFEKTIPDTKE